MHCYFWKQWKSWDVGECGSQSAPAADVEALDRRVLPTAPMLGVVNGNSFQIDTNRPTDTSAGATAPEINFNYGLPGDTIVVGNWLGRGTTAAVVRQSGVNGAPNDGLVHWYFDDDGDAEFEREAAFGLAGDRPIVGDWDGDGRDNMGVTRQSGGAGVPANGLLNWFFDLNGDKWAEGHRQFGFSTDRPVVGNWDGRRGDDLGVVRATPDGLLTWFQDTNGDVWADRQVSFGLSGAGDIPVVGDWDNNGTDNVGVARPNGGALTWYLDTNNNPAPEITRSAIAAGLVPVVGDFRLAEIDVAGIVDGQAQPVDFGTVNVGQSAVRTFTVRNRGTSTLSLRVGSLPAGFRVIEPLRATLAPGQSDTFQIRFTPTTQGAAGGAFQIFSNDGNESPFDIRVAGRGHQVVLGRVLYVNFDGRQISNSELRQWAGTDWRESLDYLDPEGDGIRVNRFLNGVANRNEIIAGIMRNLQADLAAYGIQVVRNTGSTVQGMMSTTLYFGANNIFNGFDYGSHIASDIDFHNNNRTDVGFITDENWGDTNSTILAMSDVALHEAGHTFGLYHVQVLEGQTYYPETMGLRYSVPQQYWAIDTAYLNRSFDEFVDADGHSHGSGRGPQNAHATMLRNFGLGGVGTINPVRGGVAEPRARSLDFIPVARSGLRAAVAETVSLGTETGGLVQRAPLSMLPQAAEYRTPDSPRVSTAMAPAAADMLAAFSNTTEFDAMLLDVGSRLSVAI